MTKMFNTVRVFVCGFVLSASIQGVQAQVAPAPTSAPTSVSTNGRLSIVTEEGSFENEFKSLGEAYNASNGNSYNQTLKKENEIIVMSARCGEGVFADKVTFSLYRFYETDIAPIVKSYLNYRQAHPKMTDLRQRDQALIDEVIKVLAISRFPRTSRCDPIPIALSLPFGILRLEVDDSQNPLIGPRINDGYLYDALIQNTDVLRSGMTIKREFWDKYGYNHFPTAQDALNAAVLLAGKKVLMFNGDHFSIYRFGDFPSDYKADDTQYNVFKTASVRKGWKIVALVIGKQLIPIYEPNAK